MNRRGFTITELIVVIAIISVLLALATLSFNQWQRKANIENEVKQLYADLRYAQQQAMVSVMTHRINFPSMSYMAVVRLRDENDATGTRVLQRSLPYAIRQSTPSFAAIEFNCRGLMVDPETKSICVFSDSGANVDSIVLMQSRISLGRLKNQGGACEASNIDLK